MNGLQTLQKLGFLQLHDPTLFVVLSIGDKYVTVIREHKPHWKYDIVGLGPRPACSGLIIHGCRNDGLSGHVGDGEGRARLEQIGSHEVSGHYGVIEYTAGVEEDEIVMIVH